MVDLVSQLREGVEKKYSRESLETMLLWAADEIERLRSALKDIQAHAVGVNPPRHTWYYDRAEKVLPAPPPRSP